MKKKLEKEEKQGHRKKERERIRKGINIIIIYRSNEYLIKKSKNIFKPNE